MSFKDILLKDGARIVITGDSLSYNRYGYDAHGRKNAFDCGAGLPSWSFSLRDKILSLDPYFKKAEEIKTSDNFFLGLGAGTSVPHAALFSGKVKTFEGEAKIFAKADKKIVLWFQKRINDSEIEVFSVVERDKAKRVDVKRTYIYNKTRKYVIVLEPQTRNGRAYYLLTAYYLNKAYGEKAIKKKMKKKLEEVL